MRRYWIDNLRWVTVLLVLLYHVIYFYNNKGVIGGVGRFATYMTRSSFGIYVVHYVFVAGIGYLLKFHTALPPVAVYLILAVAVFSLSPLTYEVLRRIPVIRWCVFGIK